MTESVHCWLPKTSAKIKHSLRTVSFIQNKAQSIKAVSKILSKISRFFNLIAQNGTCEVGEQYTSKLLD